MRSLETIKVSDNLGVLKLRGCQYVTEIPNLSNLINLKEFDLQHCYNLIEIHDSIGYLAKLEILNVGSCAQLKTFPRGIKSTSLRRLDLSYCSSLKYFPEILEKVKVRELRLFGTAIEKLPWSICNLSQLRVFWIGQNELVIEVPNSIFLLPELEVIRVDGHGKMVSCNWKDAQEQAIWSKQCPNRVNFHLPRCNISDDLLRTHLSRFINVKHLDLTGNNFTILPTWIKECHFLLDLVLNECKHLREVEGVPPYIRRLEAKNCISLSLKSKSLLLSEELHGAPGRHSPNKLFLRHMHFSVPSRSIPKWFQHKSKGASIAFWFHNCFPPLCLCVLFKPTDAVLKSNYSYSSLFTSVCVNNIEVHRRNLWDWNALNVDHLVVYNLKGDHIPSYEIEGHRGKNKWNHVQVNVYSQDDALVVEESGIYIVKQLHEMEYIMFESPYERLDSTSGDQGETDRLRLQLDFAFPRSKKRWIRR